MGAEENGDSVLARAIAYCAYRERNDIFGHCTPVLEAYLESRPELAAKVAELESARRHNLTTNLHAAWIFSVPKPADLERIPVSSLAQMMAEA